MDDTLGFTATIAPEITHLRQPLRDFQPHPRNARKHDLGLITASLQAHRQRTPIVVQASTMFIVKGAGTWQAAKDLGWTEIAAVVQDMDDDKALEYLLADNRASDKAEYDRKKLVSALEAMVAGPGLTDTLWSIDELDDLIAAEDAIPEVETSFAGGFAESAESIAQRTAEAAEVKEGQKRREIPLVYTVKEHAQFVEWVRLLQKRWQVRGTMATVYAAVKRQAEAEEGAVTVGAPLTEEARISAQAEALRAFAMTIEALGVDRVYSGRWLVQQLQNAVLALGVSSVRSQQPEEPIAEDPPELPSDDEDEPPLAEDPFLGIQMWGTSELG